MYSNKSVRTLTSWLSCSYFSDSVSFSSAQSTADTRRCDNSSAAFCKLLSSSVARHLSISYFLSSWSYSVCKHYNAHKVSLVRNVPSLFCNVTPRILTVTLDTAKTGLHRCVLPPQFILLVSNVMSHPPKAGVPTVMGKSRSWVKFKSRYEHIWLFNLM